MEWICYHLVAIEQAKVYLDRLEWTFIIQDARLLQEKSTLSNYKHKEGPGDFWNED